MSAPTNPVTLTQTTNTQNNSHQNENNTQLNQLQQNESKTNNNNATEPKSEVSEDENESNDNTPPPPPKAKRCPHINNIKKKIKHFKTVNCNKCHDSEPDDRLVFCLTCNKLNCSRTSTRAHAMNHWLQNNKHNVCMMIPTFEDFSNNKKETVLEMLQIWCYKCDVFLHETNQHNSPKIKKIKYEIYGCLTRGYKRLTQKRKQNYKKQNDAYNHNNNSAMIMSPNVNKTKKRKKDRYSQYKNQYNQQPHVQQRNNANAKSMEEWDKLDTDFTTKMPNDRDNGYIGIFGLCNLGNTCFFNSILQNLAETRPLIRALTDTNTSALISHHAERIVAKDKKDAQRQLDKSPHGKHKNNARARRNNYSKKQQQQAAMDKKLRGRLLTEFHHVINSVYSTVGKQKGSVTPSGLLNAVIARNRRFAGRRQQDSHELMRVLVEGMRDQNEKMLKKDRRHRMGRNLSLWEKCDVVTWCECYGIDSELDIDAEDWIEFIKNPGKDSQFWKKIGLNDKNDADCLVINKFKRGRIFLQHEECDIYCTKHGYPIKKHRDDTKRPDTDSKVHDIENKPINKMNTVIDDVFGGDIQSCVTCYGCGNVSRTTEEFFDLSLPISSPKVSTYGRYSYNTGNVWHTAGKKSKKRRKKERQQKWAAQSKKNKQNQKKNKKKGNKNTNKGESEESIELADANKGTDSNDNDQNTDKQTPQKTSSTASTVTATASTTSSPAKTVSDTPSDPATKSAVNTSEAKEEKKEKYVPPVLPSVRGMDRLKGEVNLLDCLAAFTDAELLTGSEKFQCRYCTRLALETLKANDAKWRDIMQNYVVFPEGVNKLAQSENSEGDDSESEEKEVEIIEEDMDEIDRIIMNGYPLQKHNATKQMLIHKPPQALALHLKRFEQSGYRLSKVSKNIRFPLHLDVTPYLTQECKQQHTFDSGTKCIYQLYGISVHHGSMGGGHYIAYTHKHRNDGPKDGWYYFSDSSYRAVGYKDAMKAEAYVLFYEKCENNTINNQQSIAQTNENKENDNE